MYFCRYYAKVSIMQFKAPTSSLKTITNNLTRATNIYKSLVIIQRPLRQPVFALSPVRRSITTLGHISLRPRQPVFTLSPVGRSDVTLGHLCSDWSTHRKKSIDWLSKRQNSVSECSDWSTHRRKSKYWLSRRQDNVYNQSLLFFLCVDQSLHWGILFCLLDSQSLLFLLCRSHTGKRANTGCLGGRIIFPSVATDMHAGERANTGCLGSRIIFLSVATDLHRRKSKDWLSRRQNNIPQCSLPRQPVFALSPVCISVATLGNIILPPRHGCLGGSIICLSEATEIHTGERAKTGCLGGRIMCQSVTTDLNTWERAKTGCLGGRIVCPRVCLLDSQSLLFFLCVDQSLHSDTFSCLLDTGKGA
jgi:hypothetical protein